MRNHGADLAGEDLPLLERRPGNLARLFLGTGRLNVNPGRRGEGGPPLAASRKGSPVVKNSTRVLRRAAKLAAFAAMLLALATGPARAAPEKPRGQSWRGTSWGPRSALPRGFRPADVAEGHAPGENRVQVAAVTKSAEVDVDVAEGHASAEPRVRVAKADAVGGSSEVAGSREEVEDLEPGFVGIQGSGVMGTMLP